VVAKAKRLYYRIEDYFTELHIRQNRRGSLDGRDLADYTVCSPTDYCNKRTDSQQRT
jgi:hypothetical protein